jgi:hypothetical protein
MARSDLSGSLIEADAKAEIVVRLADGRARRLTVTEAEADRLAGKGEPIGGIWRETRAYISRNWRPFAWWIFALIVASLLLPAATKQWTDRQAALDLKSSLFLKMSESSVHAVRSAHLASQSAHEKEVRKGRGDALNIWIGAQSSLDPVFHIRFENTTMSDMWKEYRHVMYDYISLACCDELSLNPPISFSRGGLWMPR